MKMSMRASSNSHQSTASGSGSLDSEYDEKRVRGVPENKCLFFTRNSRIPTRVKRASIVAALFACI